MRIDGPSENSEKRTINWFPGHMAKALNEVKKSLTKVHLVVEIRDARVPLTSGNSALQEAIGKKHHLIVLNKANLVDEASLKKWQSWFDEQEKPFLFLNSFDSSSLKAFMPKARNMVMKNRAKDTVNTSLRMMIVGLPNTGKSTLINHLMKKKAAKAADKPGLTQNQQWVTLAPGIELMDTPGIMPPMIGNDEQGLSLCAIHALKDDLVDTQTVAFHILKHIKKKCPQDYLNFYKQTEFAEFPHQELERIAKLRGHLKKGGEFDLERSATLLVYDFRQGHLGKLCFEERPIFKAKS